jgi:RecA-family ATPase
MLFLPVPVQMLGNVDVAAFGQLLVDLQPTLLILDTQARVTVGAEENSSRDMGQFVDALDELRSHSGACILVVHHEPRNGENLRGSTALEGAATTIIRVSKDGNVVELTNPKQKTHSHSRRYCSRWHPLQARQFCPTRPWESAVSLPSLSTTF